MSAPLLIPLPGNEPMAQRVAERLDGEIGRLELRAFPDEETYLRILSGVTSRNVILLCTLDRPNPKLLPLLFAASTARELGATRVGLIAPYLAYMRQDRRFKPGEAVTSREVAHLISAAFDWVVTVDPHLHRYGALSDLYSIPARSVHAAPLLSRWIKAHVAKPVLIGPDSESEQWVSAVAKDAATPYTVLEKVRHGDRDVEVSIRHATSLAGRIPVFVDDIISSGRTMLKAVQLLSPNQHTAAICLAVHGVFADQSDKMLAGAGAKVVTSNTISHPSNEIDVGEMLADAAAALMRQVSLV